jgi:ligand-binding sensor protein
LCHAGFHCINAPVTIEGDQAAVVSICQFRVASGPSSQASWEASIPALTQELDLEREELLEAGSSIREVSQDSLERASRLLLRVSETFSQIGQERLNFVSRLKDIAEMTKV